MTTKTTRPTTITPEVIAAIKAGQARGLTRKQTADACGVSLTTVALHWTPTGSGKPKAADPEEILERLAAGESVRELAQAYKCSVDTIRRYRRAANKGSK